MKKTVCAIFLLFAAGFVSAQKVAGYWYGTASVQNAGGNNYLMELILQQNNTKVNAIVNYYFRNTYRSLKINGSYNAQTRQLVLLDVPIPYAGSTSRMEVDCKMDFVATHRVAKAGSNLSGKFMGQPAYKYTCPDVVFDLALNNEANNEDSILTALRNYKETFQLWSPAADDTLVAAVVQQRTIQNMPLVRAFGERVVEVQKEIEVESDSIRVDFYDNGEVDGDSISVFFNDQLYGANLRLSTRSVNLTLGLDTTKEVNTLAMFANNLGAIAPNTALMLVYDGKKRYEVRLSSSFDKSAAVRIKRKKQR